MRPTVDSGWAWVVLAASVGVNYLSGVLVYLVGVVHVELLDRYQSDVTTTAWAGAIYSSLQNMGAPLATLLVHHYGCRVSVMAGGVLLCLGFTISSFANSVSLLVFTYGLVAGVGLGLTYTPTLMTIGFYFDRLRGLASGISACGGATGLLSGSLITQMLIDNYGLSGAFLLIGGISLHKVALGMFFRPTPHEGRRLKQNRSLHTSEGVSLKDSGSQRESRSILDGESQDGETTTEKPSEKEGISAANVGAREPLDPDLEGRQDSEAAHCAASLSWQPSNDQECERERLLTGNSDRDSHCMKQVLDPTSDENGTCTHQLDWTSDRGPFVPPNSFECVKNTHAEHAAERNAAYLGHSVLANGTTTVEDAADCKTTHVSINHDDFCSQTDANSCSENAQSGRVHHSIRTSPAAWVQKTGIQQMILGFRPLVANRAFMCHCVSLFCSNVSQCGVLLHLPEYAKTQGTEVTMAATLFVGVGVFSIVSRLGCGVLTMWSRADAFCISIGLMTFSGTATALFPLYSATFIGQMAFACLLGLFTGGLYTLINVLTVQLVGFGNTLAMAYGLGIFIMGVGCVFGPPLAGIIVDSGGTYEHSFIFLGVTMFVAAAFDVLAKLVHKSPDGKLNFAKTVEKETDQDVGNTLMSSKPDI